MSFMTRRQRVTAAIRHQIPDRMPIDLGMYTAGGISAFAYQNLVGYLGLNAEPAEVYEPVQMLARVERSVLERLHCDCILLNPPMEPLGEWNPRGDYRFRLPAPCTPFHVKGLVNTWKPGGGYVFNPVHNILGDVPPENILAAYDTAFAESAY